MIPLLKGLAVGAQAGNPFNQPDDGENAGLAKKRAQDAGADPAHAKLVRARIAKKHHENAGGNSTTKTAIYKRVI